jgi:hypothetical protein
VVFTGLAMSSLRLFDHLVRDGDRERAEALAEHLTEVMPEFWQAYVSLAELQLDDGDTAAAVAIYQVLQDTLTAYIKTNPENQNYVQDLGSAKMEIGLLTGDADLVDAGVRLVKEGFDMDRNSGLAYLKAATAMQRAGLTTEIYDVTRKHAEYKKNLEDPRVQAILGYSSPGRQPGR